MKKDLKHFDQILHFIKRSMPLMIRERSIINYSLNFLSAIFLIFISKILFRRFPISPFTLSIFNNFFSGLFATLALRFIGPAPPANPNRPKTSFLHIFGITIVFSIYLLLSNFSLLYNVIGTYEILKSFVPPILMIIEIFQLIVGLNTLAVTRERISRDYSLLVFAAFLIIIISSTTYISFDANLRPIGLTCGVMSVIINPIYQTLIQGESSNTIYDRTRFLQIQSFLSLALLLPLWPLVDQTFATLSHVFIHFQPIFLFGLAGFFAFLVNATAIWCIKDDAATGFNIVGQLKILPIIFFGSAFFREKFTLKQLICVLGTIVGSMIYICLSHHKREKHKQQISSNAQ